MASFLDRIFKKSEKNPQKQQQTIDIIHGENGSFSSWHGDYYNNPTYRTATDVIARNGAKLKAIHFIGDDKGHDKLNHLLQVRPNPYQTSYDLFYKLITHLYLKNNAYLFVQRNEQAQTIGLYNVDFTSTEYGTDSRGELMVKFHMHEGKTYILPYNDLIHIKRHFNKHKFIGDPNNSLDETLYTSEVQTEGITAGIKLNANIRGVLTFTELTNEGDMKERSDKFIKEYLTISNNGGVVVADKSLTYTPIDSKGYSIDKDQIKIIEDKIYHSLGLNRSIVSSDYTEEQFQAFYEEVIEPIALQLGLEFTVKLFSEKEQLFGNRIVMDSHRLNYASLQSRINLVQQTYPYGILSVNEARELMNLPKLDNPEEGDRRYQTLNIVGTDVAEEYQLKGVDNKFKSAIKDQQEGNDSKNQTIPQTNKDKLN